ncbi:MAG: ATP-binding protein [Candidatus Aenigmatarchaeota archaeon]
MIKKENIIDYFKEYEELRVEMIPRELKVPLTSNFIISLIGPRRAGKTYYFFSLANQVRDFTYLNFEDSRLYGARYDEIREILRTFIELYGREPKYLFFDEVQNVEKWEIIVRELHDLKKYRIFLTGSSSKLLAKEIATQLRGRTLSFLLLPFSFREYLVAKKVSLEKYLSKDKQAKLKNLLRDYLEFGGFPDVVMNKEKLNILKEYSDLILFRDFIERHKVKNIELARFIHSFIIQNFSNEISVRSIFNKLKSMKIKISKDSVYNYVEKLEDTVFFFFLKRFSKKVHLREAWPRKVYSCDTGIAKIVRFSPDYGRLMENCVFLELIREKNKNPLAEVFYLKLNNKEIDFLIKVGEKIHQLIQVSYASNRDEIEKKDIDSLVKGASELKCNNLLFLTWDYEEEIKVENKKIVFKPLWKWLLKV